MRKLISIVFIASLSLAACSDEGNGTPDGGTGNPDSGTVACDPNAGPVHVKMLNATLEQGVDSVKKTPQHPGAPGPDGLP